MNISVYFEDSGLTEEYDFNFEPRPGDEIFLVQSGVATKYTVSTRSGIQVSGGPSKTLMLRVIKPE